MTRSVLEKWYQKGRLKYGSQQLSAEERLCAGRVFYQSYINSHIISVGVSDWMRARLDGGVRLSSVESLLGKKDVFLKAYQQIPKNARFVVERIVLENKDICARRGDMKIWVELICSALDSLAFYYILQREKQ